MNQKKSIRRMLIYPMSAVDLCFFTRRSGRTETCDCLLTSPGENRGHGIHISTRNPFLNLWVKAQTGAHPRINARFGALSALPSIPLYAAARQMSSPLRRFGLFFRQIPPAVFRAARRRAAAGGSRRCRCTAAAAFVQIALRRARQVCRICVQSRWNRA